MILYEVNLLNISSQKGFYVVAQKSPEAVKFKACLKWPLVGKFALGWIPNQMIIWSPFYRGDYKELEFKI
jgi:hypothetical protein